MNQIELQWLTEPLAVVLTGNGVFVISIIIATIFCCIYKKNKSRKTSGDENNNDNK